MGEDFDENRYDPRGLIQVFWNMEDYPIPASANLRSISHNIISALKLMGFRAQMDILAFGDKLNHTTSDMSHVGISHVPKNSGDEDSAVDRMSRFMLVYAARSCPDRPLRLVVIAKQNPGSEFDRVLNCLKSRDFTVVLVEPDDETAQDSLFPSVNSVLYCSQFLGEVKPISTRPRSPTCSSESDSPRSRMFCRSF